MCGLFSLGGTILLQGQTLPRFTPPRLFTNREIGLTLATTNGVNYRIDTSPDASLWSPWITLTGAVPSLSLTDSAAPYLRQRLYRAEQLPGSNVFTGDHLTTAEGDVVIRPMGHATFVMKWQGKMIYNDPTNGAPPYAGFPRADLILVSHDHGDHFSSSTLDAVRTSNTVIVVPNYVYTNVNGLSAAQRTLAVVLTNGASTNLLGLTITAVPAYNANHPVGRGNGYVLTLGGKRLYMSGDTGDIPETRALTNIDVAFLCMNVPFTMDHTNAASVVRAFRPAVVYPYHYKNQNGSFPDLNDFKRRVGQDLGIEVRLRKWY
jgi:L-ascorbate metabolism protein UlaG (beta-lactamase superfamily)